NSLCLAQMTSRQIIVCMPTIVVEETYAAGWSVSRGIGRIMESFVWQPDAVRPGRPGAFLRERLEQGGGGALDFTAAQVPWFATCAHRLKLQLRVELEVHAGEDHLLDGCACDGAAMTPHEHHPA